MDNNIKNQRFIDWLRSKTVKGRIFFGLGTILSWFLTQSLFVYYKLTPPFTGAQLETVLKTREGFVYRGVLAIIHAAACFAMAAMTPRPRADRIDNGRANVYIPDRASARIRNMVVSLYMSLALLYSVMAVFTFLHSPQPAESRWLTVCEILTATLIFFLYIELSEITVEPKERFLSPLDARPEIRARMPGDAHSQRLLFSWFALGLTTLTILSTYFHSPNLQTGVRVIVACLSGVTLAMVIGRLGSLYLNPGTVIIFLLYLYAVIQSFASFFPKPLIVFLVTSVALPLKVILWLVFTWAFTSGKIFEYVQEVRIFLERQEEEQY